MSVNGSLPGVSGLFCKSDDSFLGADDSLCGMGGSCRGTDAPFEATGNSFSSTDGSFQAADGSFPGADYPRSYKNGEFSLKSQKLEEKGSPRSLRRTRKFGKRYSNNCLLSLTS